MYFISALFGMTKVSVTTMSGEQLVIALDALSNVKNTLQNRINLEIDEILLSFNSFMISAKSIESTVSLLFFLQI